MSKPLSERTWLAVFIVMLLYALVLFVPQIVMGMLDVGAPLFDLVNLFIYAVFWFYVVPFGLKLPQKAASLKDYLAAIRLDRLEPPGGLIAFGALVGGLFLASSAALTWLAGSFGPDIGSVLPPENWILLYGNIGAFFEEVAIRGVLLALLLSRYEPRKAVLLSAFIFGIGHIITFFLGNELLVSLIQVMYAFLLGIVFGAMVLKSGSLLPGIVSHMLINSLNGVLVGSLEPVQASIITILAALLTAVISLALMRGLGSSAGLEEEPISV